MERHSCLEQRLTKQSNDGAMPETRPPIELQGLSLAELQKLIDERRLPPVDQWNPERCGHSGCASRATAPGIIEGAPIRRPAMVRLFSTVLRREPDGRHVLVTPVEKLDIDVDAHRLPRGRDAQRGRRARPAHRLPARQRRCRDSRSGSSAADRRNRARPVPAHRSSAMGSKPSLPPGLLRARRARAGRGRTIRRASGAAARSSRWSAANDASPTGCAPRSPRRQREPPLEGDLPNFATGAASPRRC